MVVERFSLEYNSEQLVGAVHLPQTRHFESCILLLHGGPGGEKEGPSELFVKMADALVKKEFTVIRFDFLGEGESSGEYVNQAPSTQVKQYQHVVSWIAERGCQQLGVVGESFGATCALSGYSEQVKALVLLWPAIWLMDVTFEPLIAPYLDQLEKHGWIDADGQKIGRQFVNEIYTHDNREAELKTLSAPTLLIHGDEDAEVPVHQSRKAYEILPGPKRLVVVPGANHGMDRNHEQTLVIQETIEWLTIHLNA